MNFSSLLATSGFGGLEFDASSLQQLDPAAPSYWLYPGLHCFKPAKDPQHIQHDYLQAAAHATRGHRQQHATSTLSLTAGPLQEQQPAPFLANLSQEIALQGQLLGKLFQIGQLQLRGSLPATTALPAILDQIEQHFSLGPVCVREIELQADADAGAQFAPLRTLGFSRLRLLLKNPPACASHAQRLSRLIGLAREWSFESVAVTLEYGHSQHTMLALARTLKVLLAACPDRIELRIASGSAAGALGDMACPDTARTQLAWCIRHLHAAQYHYLGSMVFARPQEPLVRAQIMGRLHRNLGGYACQDESNHIGCGPGAVSCFGNFYSANHDSSAAYTRQLQAGYLPLAKSLHLSMDDLLRRVIIHLLLCNFELSIESLELTYPINFCHYFAAELPELKTMAQRDWLRLDDTSLLVLARGRLFITQICSVFERNKPTLACQQATSTKTGADRWLERPDT